MKMSGSDDDSAIFLNDSAAAIAHKVKDKDTAETKTQTPCSLTVYLV